MSEEELYRNKLYVSSPTSLSLGHITWFAMDTKLVGRVKALIDENENNKQQLDKYKNVIDKIKEILTKHINNANEELQIILKNNNDLEYKNQCSHDFEIIKQNVEIIYNDILELLEEVE